MNSILDNINESFQTVSISRFKYDSLILAERQRNDLFDLIEIRVRERGILSYNDLKLIYDMQIRSALEENGDLSANKEMEKEEIK